MVAILRRASGAAALAAGIAIAGCGLPGAPLPPTLNLPKPIADLTAARAGDQVSLHWTTPERNTDHLLLKGSVQLRICRRERASEPCAAVATVEFAPGASGDFAENLPAPLAGGSPRALSYFVEALNGKGRSAGLSNAATVLAGAAPPPITGLNAEMVKDGVALHWNAVSPAQEAGPTVVRLQRTLMTPAPAKPANGLLTPPPEPVHQSLLVPAGSQPGVALDKDIRFGETYEYRAQRVTREAIDGNTLELPGVLSLPVRIHAVNAFPPAAPTGLVAIGTPAQGSLPPSIDLSWQPDAEPGIAGYIVYRREDDRPWQRISPAQPVVGPAFHDAQVEPGRTYIYAVSAMGTSGLESARSSEAQETVSSQ